MSNLQEVVAEQCPHLEEEDFRNVDETHSPQLEEDSRNDDKAHSKLFSLFSEELDDDSRNVNETHSKCFLAYVEKISAH